MSVQVKLGRWRTIPLDKGFSTIVDLDLFETELTYHFCGHQVSLRPSAQKWSAKKSKSKFYVRGSIWLRGRPVDIRLHRLLVECPADMVVDHRDGNPMNNTKHNLRICTHSQNRRNSPACGSVGLKGVVLEKGKYRAQINFDGKNRHLGRFATKEEAAIAYDLAALEAYGEFARTNFAGGYQ